MDLQLLGEVTVRRAGNPVACSSVKALELLGLLVVRRARAVPRDLVAELLWPDEPIESARRSLRQALWRLKVTLAAAAPDPGVRPALAPDTRAGWLRADVGAFASIDLLELEAAHVATADRPGADLSEGEAARLERVAGFGELLPGCDGEWVEPERARVQELTLAVRDQLVGYHSGQGRHALALEHGRTVLEADPGRETTHRLLMKLHHRRGDRAAASRQYLRCVAALEAEYGVAPSAPTVLLHRRIQGETSSSSSAPAPEGLEELNRRLDDIQSVLDVLLRAVVGGERPGTPDRLTGPAPGSGW